jgi:hypothetical protein
MLITKQFVDKYINVAMATGFLVTEKSFTLLK